MPHFKSMVKKSFGVLMLVIGLLLTLFFNGTYLAPSLGIPSLGKILNPFHGLYSTYSDKDEITLDGKDGPIEIIKDSRGVPHIYAQTMNDAFYGQGYIEAMDRTFQMQFVRQVATGQLSEYFGERTLAYDKWTHKKGLPTSIKNTAKVMSKDPEVKASHTAYVDGANLFIGNMSPADFPFEMKLLGLTPKLWDLESATSIFKYIGNMLAGGNRDIEHTNARILLGEKTYSKYYSEKESIDEPVIPTEVKYEFDSLYNAGVKSDELFEQPIYDAYFEKRNKNIGSNNWAVSGDKTASGSPILCSDPHLSMSLPSIWYEVNLITPETDVYGVSFPGLPGIMIGFNEHISWGETNVGHDVQDLFHINYTDDSRKEYWLDGKKVPVEYRYDTIRVKDKPSIIDTNIITKWGPIIKRSNDGKTDIAMNWLVAHEAPAAEGNTFVKCMQCKDYDCFLRETAAFITPAQNFLYADNHGDIGLRVNGLLPARIQDDGKFVEEGDSIKNGWQHWIPREQNPQAKNPEQGYLTSSNQRSAGQDYPYYYYSGNFEKYRSRAINDHLDTVSNVTMKDMMTFQNNNYSKLAEDMMPLMLANIRTSSLTSEASKLVETMSNWDYNYEADYTAPALFEYWYSELSDQTWDEIAAYQDTMSLAYPSSSMLRDLIINEPDDVMFDKVVTIKKETAKDIIQMSFDSLVAYADRHDEEYLKWGNRNNVRINHLARVPGLGSGKLFAGGSGDVINATSGSWGPSWRMIVSLEKEVSAYGIYPGGQSGDPRNKRYMDLVEKWRTGNYDKLIYGVSKDELKRMNNE